MREALGGRRAGVRNAHDEVDVGGGLHGEAAPHRVAHRVDRGSLDEGVGAREVDELEDAARPVERGDALHAREAVVGDADDLAGLHVAHEGRADDVERAGLTGHDPAAVPGEPSQDERADAARVAEGVQRVVAQHRHRVAALDHRHRVRDALAQVARLLGEVADELRGHLGVRVGAEGQHQVREVDAQLVGVDERAVVGEGDQGAVDRRDVGLGGLPAPGARGPVAHVPDRDLAGERGEVHVAEHLVHETQVLPDEHRGAVADGDARRVLAAVLQRAQGEVGEAGHVELGGPDAEDAALLPELVVVRLAALRRPDVMLHLRPPSLPAGHAYEETSPLGTQTRTVRPSPSI